MYGQCPVVAPEPGLEDDHLLSRPEDRGFAAGATELQGRDETALDFDGGQPALRLHVGSDRDQNIDTAKPPWTFPKWFLKAGDARCSRSGARAVRRQRNHRRHRSDRRVGTGRRDSVLMNRLPSVAKRIGVITRVASSQVSGRTRYSASVMKTLFGSDLYSAKGPQYSNPKLS